MKPFYRYLGGKTKEIKFFSKYFPDKYDLYVEPFFGGGAVFWNLEPQKAIINDIDTTLMEFLRYVKTNPEVFKVVENFWPVNKEFFERVRDHWTYSGEIAEVQRYFYFLRTSFNGYLRFNDKKQKYNMSFGNKKVITPIPEENIKLLQNAVITNTDYTEILKTYDAEETFMFLDPPYDGLFNYLHDSSDKSSIVVILETLKDFISNCKSKCLMTTGATPFTEALFKDFIKDSYIKHNSFGAHCKGKDNNLKTLIITNY